MAKYVEILRDGTRREVTYNPKNDGPVTLRKTLVGRLNWLTNMLKAHPRHKGWQRKQRQVAHQINLLDSTVRHGKSRSERARTARVSGVSANAAYTTPRSKESEVNLGYRPLKQSSCSSTASKVTKPCHRDGVRNTENSVAYSQSHQERGRSTMPPPAPVAGPESLVKPLPYSSHQTAQRSTVIANIGANRQLPTTERPLLTVPCDPSACSSGVESNAQRLANGFNCSSTI